MSEIGNKRYTALVGDDDPDLLQLLTDGLELIGNFTVVSATNGMQGLGRFLEIRSGLHDYRYQNARAGRLPTGARAAG